MVKKTLKLSVALPILACSVVLAGCGGGSGGVSMPGDSMDDSKGMTGAGTVTAPVALISGIDRDFTTSRTNLLMDDGMTTVTESAGEWNLTVDRNSVTFTAADLGVHPQIGPGIYFKDLGNNEFGIFWSQEMGGFDGTPQPEFDYLDVYGFAHATILPGADVSTSYTEADFARANRVHIIHGTPTSTMPVSGSATYGGRVGAREWSSDDAMLATSAAGYAGDFSLRATFGSSETAITGSFSNLRRWATPEATTFIRLPGSIPFETTVVGNQLALSGLSIDSGPLAGFENIGIRGTFFGPQAAEVGGVFEGENPTTSTLLQGWFAGKQN